MLPIEPVIEQGAIDSPVSLPRSAHVDVWSRTDPKYRRRAVALLIVNVLLFSGLTGVAYWLRTGVVFAPAAENYWQTLADTFLPTLETKHTPTGLSLAPISIEQVPMMIPVLGLVLAALVSIPILTAMLYRFPCSLPFILAVGFVAVMPWLALVLLASCLIASVRPFRSSSRFASALMSLLPVIIYFFMASRQSEPVVDVLANPADRIKVVAPLVMAVIGSAIVMGIVLIIARVVNYRPGAISPLLAILFLAPAAMFEYKVGRDELHYRLLEREFGPGSQYFIQEEIQSEFESSVEAEWARKRSEGVTRDAVRDLMTTRWLLALDPRLTEATSRYTERAAEAAGQFVKQFPDSVYACNALYLKGRALDMRVNLNVFKHRHAIRFNDGFPSEKSRRAWELIDANAAESPTAAVALLRLAQLDAREGAIDSAIAHLEKLISRFTDYDPAAHTPRSTAFMGIILERQPPEAAIDIPVARHLFEGRRLLDLLSSNRDPLYGDEPLAQYLRADPRDLEYPRKLSAILKRFANCQLADNIQLALAVTLEPPDERIDAVRMCARQAAGGDASAEAQFRLGETYAELKDAPAAREAFRTLIEQQPNSIWRDPAEAHLRKLDAAPLGQE